MKIPLTIEYDKSANPDSHNGSFVIYNADRSVLINGGTYTHDGDMEVNINWKEAIELVNMINLANL